MSINNNARLLIIGEHNANGKIAESQLLTEARTYITHPQLEWLFFYKGNMGIITEEYAGRLITGYPQLAFGKNRQPFSDSISKELFVEFFSRFLFAKNIQLVLMTTFIGFGLIKRFARSRKLKLIFYQPALMQVSPDCLQELRGLEIYSPMENATLQIKKVNDFNALIELLLKQLSL